MHEVRFTLHLRSEQMRDHYRGDVQFVHVLADNGQRVRFPAIFLRPHLTPQGVHGRFRLSFDHNHRLKELQRCTD